MTDLGKLVVLSNIPHPLHIFSFQSHQVTTEVFPSEMGEAPIPWWVWLLAALGGLLLLALICYCLYKVKQDWLRPFSMTIQGVHKKALAMRIILLCQNLA